MELANGRRCTPSIQRGWQMEDGGGEAGADESTEGARLRTCERRERGWEDAMRKAGPGPEEAAKRAKWMADFCHASTAFI